MNHLRVFWVVVMITLSTVMAEAIAPCSVGGIQFTGLLQYLAGQYRIPGSIYADCVDGQPICYEDDGISDTTDRVISCDNVNLESRRRRLGVYIDQNFTWPNRVVCVNWTQPFSKETHVAFDKAIKEYYQMTDITFIDVNLCRRSYGKKTAVCDDCRTAVKIQRSEKGCFATVGHINSMDRILNLAQSCARYDTVLHELGHVVGLSHEHSHPQRTVIVLRNKISATKSNYLKRPDFETTDYDPNSIMHYNGKALCIPRDPTINFCDINETKADGCVVPKEEHCDRSKQKLFGQGKDLTAGDITTVRKLYMGIERPGRPQSLLRSASQSSPIEQQAP
ncbi:hypothetical protein Poli38472_007732 [Pythium oligandrum]|uniref:Metalloendopeptidase n=1 Tax=Pythium oligandrum TaxID=41045 RepID=A0A8K1CSS7_PYTOL|nr:hypothetical protein Poli38472_007732 [Pythium oligandrum]|eukprot:TMW68060.1 hypothetical protein Poli38472_007732 [Pythium oligandrum]